MTDSIIIARRIRGARQRQGLTQGELATKAHWTRRSVQNWESGARLPSVDAIADMAKALGVSPAWLAGWKE